MGIIRRCYDEDEFMERGEGKGAVTRAIVTARGAVITCLSPPPARSGNG